MSRNPHFRKRSPRPKRPWRFHGAGAIECLLHAPGVIVHAGTCPECDADQGRTKREKYPGVGTSPDPYDPGGTLPGFPSWEHITTEVIE